MGSNGQEETKQITWFPVKKGEGRYTIYDQMAGATKIKTGNE